MQSLLGTADSEKDVLLALSQRSLSLLRVSGIRTDGRQAGWASCGFPVPLSDVHLTSVPFVVGRRVILSS